MIGLHIAVAAPAQAAPADLDSTFGGDGKVSTDFRGLIDEGRAVAVQPDGKIIVVGVVDGPSTDFGLARYQPDGTLDAAFGTAGKVTTDFAGGTDQAFGVTIDSAGRIVVAGSITQAGGAVDFGLARYHANGTLDGTFDGDGKVSTDFAAGTDQGFGVAVSAGKIVVAGSATTSFGDVDFALARYHPDGALDTGFDTDGKVSTDFAGDSDAVHGLAIQSNGRIVAAGLSASGGDGNFGLARYHPNGALDTGFDTDGKVSTDFAGNFDQAFAVAIRPDGKIVAAGQASDATGHRDFGVVRYDGDPAPPPSANLSVGKTDSPDPVPVNATLTYTLTVGNAGPNAATGVTVTDALPASVSPVSVTPSQGSCTSGPGPVVTCYLGTVTGTGSATVTIVVTPQTAGSLSNTATVSSSVTDPNPANNIDTETTSVTGTAGCTITGTPGNDMLVGTSGSDVVCGLGGDDNIAGLGGDDTLLGGPGDDHLAGGGGDDTVIGGSGSDNLTGGGGNDTLDSIDGVSGNDVNIGGSGSDTCTPDPGDFTIC